MWPWGDQLERKGLECLKCLLYKNKSGLYYCTVPAFCFPLGFLSFHGLTSFPGFQCLFCDSHLLYFIRSQKNSAVIWLTCSILQCSMELGQPFFSYVCLFAFNSLEPKQLCLIWQLLSEVGLVENNSKKPVQTPTLSDLCCWVLFQQDRHWEFCKLTLRNQVDNICTSEITTTKTKIKNKNFPPSVNAYLGLFLLCRTHLLCMTIHHYLFLLDFPKF